MVEDTDDLPGVEFAVAIEVAQQFFLLGIHGDHGFAGLEVLLLEAVNVLELGVAVGMTRPQGLGLLRLAFDVAVLPQQLLDHPLARRRPTLRQPPGNLLPRQVGPLDLLPHRVAGGVITQHLQKVLLQRHAQVDESVASAPFFRTRPAAGSASNSKSKCPCPMV
jgi:hypothetical protein